MSVRKLTKHDLLLLKGHAIAYLKQFPTGAAIDKTGALDHGDVVALSYAMGMLTLLNNVEVDVDIVTPNSDSAWEQGGG